MSALSIVAHIPHASTFIPHDVRASIYLDESQLQREILLLTDWFVDELFSWFGTNAVTFGASRLVVDPERFIDDHREVMASRGMGVIYTKTTDGGDLRRTPSESEREDLLNRFYRPHARLMESVVQSCLDEHEFCLILDCHSFASRPLPFELDQDAYRPDMCIGTDDFHTPRALVRTMELLFRSFGWKVLQNRPYAGTYLPLRFFHSNKRVLSIMVEVNRRLYMDEATGLKTDTFEAVQKNLAELGTVLAAFAFYRR